MSHFLGAMILTSRGFQDIKYNIPVRRFVRPSVRPWYFRISILRQRLWPLTKHQDDIVANIKVDEVTDNVADMVANMGATIFFF